MNYIIFAITLLLFGVTSPQAQPVTNDTLFLSRAGLLSATGEYGRPYVIEYADELSNLTSWTYLTNFDMPGIGSEFSMNIATRTNSQRFYRILRGPVLADSVSDFSGVQGSNNWYYGYYVSPFTPAQFIQFDKFTNGLGTVGGWTPSGLNVWTRAFQIGGIPNGTTTSGGRLHVEHWMVRRWQSPDTRTIKATMYIRDLSVFSNGNGVVMHVILDGVELTSYTLPEGGEHFQTFAADVQAGSLLDFIIDPHNSSDLTDVTEFRILIY